MWSPDGKQIIFKNTIIHKTPPLNQYGEIYITDLKGNQETLISGKDYGKGPLSLGPLGWTQAGEIVWLQTNFSVHGESPRQRTDLKLIDPHTKQIRVLAEDIMSSAIWRQPGQAPTIDMNKQAP